MAKKKSKKVSKFAIDEEKLKSDTIPNPVVTGGMEAIGLTRISPIEIPKYLLMHPALPRGIEIKANRMVKLVDEDLEENIIINKSKGEKAEEAKEYCKKLLYDSGGPIFLKELVQGAYRFGTSFSVLQTDIAETEVLRFEYQHEIFFGASKYPTLLRSANADWGDIPMMQRPSLAGKMKINPKTKKIAKYTQLTRKYPERHEDNYKFNSEEYVNTRTHPALKESSPGELVPVGNEIDEDYVIQLAFDRIGDEPLGISLVQFLHLTIKYLLNMERGGAQSIVNFGFNKWKANTPFKDENKMRAFGQSLANINTDAVVVLPKDIILENIQPGTTDFDRVHPIYLKLIAMRLGIPMPLLTQSGTETNKNTITEMRKDMYEDFIADELIIEKVMNDGFFKACKIKYNTLSIKELEGIAPKFKFKQPPEDLNDEMERNLKESLMIRNYSMSAQMWFEIGDPSVLTNIGTKVNNLLEKGLKLDKKQDTSGAQKLIDKKQKINQEKKSKNKEDEKEIKEQLDNLKKKK